MKDERGFGYLLAMIITAWILLFGLAMSFSSTANFSMSVALENKTKAFMAADAGYNAARASLQGNDLNVLLATSTTVPKYLNYPEPQEGSSAYVYFIRNPLAPIEALNVDFNHPPSPIGERQSNGFLTPAEGVLVSTGERYWSKLTDNDDGDSDFNVDTDGMIYLRTLVVKPNPGEVVSYGSATKNSVAVVEGKLKRDGSLRRTAVLVLYGRDVYPYSEDLFETDSFKIDGYDHSGWTTTDILSSHTHSNGQGSAGIHVLYDDLDSGDAIIAMDSIYNSLTATQKSKITGPESDYTGTSEPSLRDYTAEIRNGSNLDALKIFDPNYMANFISKVTALAQLKYPDQTSLSGSDIELGTETHPQITVADGDFSLSGTVSGAGILVVKGHFDSSATLTYRGLVLVVGKGSMSISGQKGVIGGVFLAKLTENTDGTYSYGVPRLSIGQGINLYYSDQDVRTACDLFPLQTISWREITPGVEPPN